jgi:hypothetical protein
VLAEWGVKPVHMWMQPRTMDYFFCVRRMSDDHLSKKVLDAELCFSNIVLEVMMYLMMSTSASFMSKADYAEIC